jgi:hypothetical protein
MEKSKALDKIHKNNQLNRRKFMTTMPISICAPAKTTKVAEVGQGGRTVKITVRFQ